MKSHEFGDLRKCQVRRRIAGWTSGMACAPSAFAHGGTSQGDSMPRITPVQPADATGKAKQLLDAVQAKLGLTPNLMKTLATSPAALEAYLNFGAALAGGGFDARLREQIAVAVAQANSCEYCLAAHTALGQLAGLKPEEIA